MQPAGNGLLQGNSTNADRLVITHLFDYTTACIMVFAFAARCQPHPRDAASPMADGNPPAVRASQDLFLRAQLQRFDGLFLTKTVRGVRTRVSKNASYSTPTSFLAA